MVLALVLLLCPLAAGDWSAFGHDSGRTGATDEVPPLDGQVAWRRDGFHAWLVGGGLVFGEVFSDNGTRFAAVSVVTGETIWEREEVLPFPLAYHEGLLYIGDYNRLVCLLGVTGDTVWESNFTTYGSFAVHDGRLIATVETGLAALDLTTGEVVWQANTTSPFIGFISMEGGRLAGWTRDAEQHIRLAVHSTGNGTRLRLLDAVSAGWPRTPVIADGKVIFVESGNDTTLSAWDIDSGIQHWNITPDGLAGMWSSGVVAVSDGTAVDDGTAVGVYYNDTGFCDADCAGSWLIAVNTTSGAERWRAKLVNVSATAVQSPVIAGGRVLLYDRVGALRVHDLTTGASVTELSVGNLTTTAVYRSNVMVSDGRLLFEGKQGTIAFGVPVATLPAENATGPDGGTPVTGSGETDGPYPGAGLLVLLLVAVAAARRR